MEKLHLAHPLLTNLYKNNLVAVENQERSPSTSVEANTDIRYKGGYEKKILWLHREPAAPFIAEDDFEMVTKILEACRLGWNDIALANMTTLSQIDEAIAALLPNCVIDSTGDTSTECYAVSNKNNIEVLYTHPLKAIRQDKNLKISLWNALKIIFKMN